jgi:ubiquinone biosynthesis monooxygenase Coq6
VALIGDAAHRVHPLAGQGVNLGFGDVECLRDQLIDAVRKGRDLGSHQQLRDYESSRMKRVVPVMAVVDALDRVYSNRFSPLVLMRSAFCKTANAVKPINAAMIRFAAS